MITKDEDALCDMEWHILRKTYFAVNEGNESRIKTNNEFAQIFGQAVII